MILTLLRCFDLLVLALALPLFLIAGLPVLAYAGIAAAWLTQRGVRALAVRRAVATGDRQAALGVMAGTMLARLWLVTLSVLGVGLIERDAGLPAALLAAALFTVSFSTLLVVKPLEEAGS
ncbi:MAG: hypothetical protein WD993_07315 [Thermoleophilaceae bacterium]